MRSLRFDGVFSRASFQAAACESALHRFLASHWRHFAAALLAFVVIHFQEFAHYTLRIDEEIAAYDHAGGYDRAGERYLRWIPVGRWGISLVHALFVEWPLNPYYSMACFGVLLSASFLVLCRATQTRLDPLVMLSCTVFAGSPVWYYIIEFKGTLIAYGLGVFFAAVAGAAFVSRPPFARPLFVLCVVAAVSIYQATLLVTLAVCFASLLARPGGTPRAFVSALAELFVLALCAVGVNLAIWNVLLGAFDLQARYITDFLDLAPLLAAPGAVAGETARQLLAVYSGTADLFLGAFPFSGLLFGLGLAALAVRLQGLGAPRSRVVVSCLLLSFLLGAPFLLHPLSGGTLPARVIFAAAVVHWFVAVQALQSAKPVLRLSAALLTVLVAFQYFQIASVASFSHQFVARHDRLVASEVYHRMADAVGEFRREARYPVFFSGSIPFPNTAGYPHLGASGGVTGVSVFGCCGVNPYRIRNFMGLLGLGEFTIAGEEERARVVGRVAAMPSWPSPGSVRVIDGIIVVKFGEPAGGMH